jgi:hypothetical protein
MLNYSRTNQATALQDLSDMPGVHELDDRAAESISGGYRLSISGASGNVLYQQNFKSIRGIDGGGPVRLGGQAQNISVQGAPGSQYKVTLINAQTAETTLYTAFASRSIKLRPQDQKPGLYGLAVNRIK